MKVKYESLADLLRYSRHILTVPSGEFDNGRLALSAVANLSDYGYTLNKEGIRTLSTASSEDITEWYYKTASILNEWTGGSHVYEPFYPNFPEQVLSMSDLELFIDQLTHYYTVAVNDFFGDGTVEVYTRNRGRAMIGDTVRYRNQSKAYVVKEVSGDEATIKQLDSNIALVVPVKDLTIVPLKKGIKSLEEHPLKVLSTVDRNDKEKILSLSVDVFRNTIKTKLTPSVPDTDNIINTFTDAVSDWTAYATDIDNRQVLRFLYLKALQTGKPTDSFPALITGDYLKIAQMYELAKKTGKMDGNVLALVPESTSGDNKVKVGTMPRSLRRFIIYGLDGQKNLEEDVAREKTAFKKLFRFLHTGEFTDAVHLKKVVDKLLSNERLDTFYSRIDKAIIEERYSDLISLYKSRPGEFIKNVNRLLTLDIADEDKRLTFHDEFVVAFAEVLSKARGEDIIRLIGYLRSRTRADRLPVHSVKGKLIVDERDWSVLPGAVVSQLVGIAKNVLISRLKKEEPLGKIYIDPELIRIPLPTEVSDKTGSANSYPRGSRLPIERNSDGSAKDMRFFIWWTNTAEDRIDLDLSANLYKWAKDGSLIATGSVSYWNGLKNDDQSIIHSGDITDGGEFGGKGVAEFIDIDVERAKKNADIIRIYVNSFTGIAFRDMPCLGGWMERDELDRSDLFDVRAVKQTSSLSSGNCKGLTLVIFDLESEEVIWTDSPDQRAVMSSNSSNVLASAGILLDRYAKGDMMNMHEMARLIAESNGCEITDDAMDADTIFCIEIPEEKKEDRRVITCKDQDIWLGEFMSL